MNSFFLLQPQFVDAFQMICDYTEKTDSSIMLRVQKGFIGLARKGERCLWYVSKNDSGFSIKFIHLYASEKFDPEKTDLYRRLVDQAIHYFRQFSIKLK